jgi:hypothetical protein
MKFIEAKYIIDKYISALAKGTAPNGIARYQSLLPCSKEKIYDAFKIFLAYSIKHNSYPPEILGKYIASSAYVTSFINDDHVEIFDEMFAQNKLYLIEKDDQESNIFIQYWESMLSVDEFDKITSFVEKIQKLDLKDRYYCRKVYELAGLKYYSDYEDDFF